MSNIDEIGFLETNLSRQLGWIAAADSKGSFVFALDTAMLGVLAAVLPKTGDAWSVAPAIVAAFSALFGVASLLFLCFAFFPRTEGPKNSLIFFGGIVQRDAAQFASAVSQLTPESYTADLVAQCHRNAEIAHRKFVWVRRALISLFLAVVPWGIAIILLYNA